MLLEALGVYIEAVSVPENRRVRLHVKAAYPKSISTEIDGFGEFSITVADDGRV